MTPLLKGGKYPTDIQLPVLGERLSLTVFHYQRVAVLKHAWVTIVVQRPVSVFEPYTMKMGLSTGIFDFLLAYLAFMPSFSSYEAAC